MGNDMIRLNLFDQIFNLKLMQTEYSFTQGINFFSTDSFIYIEFILVNLFIGFFNNNKNSDQQSIDRQID